MRRIPRGGGAEVVVAVKVEGVVENGVREPQFPDAPIDGIQPQIIDDHVGGDVVRADDHHGSGILDLELCARAQRPQHSGAVNELAFLVGDLFLKAGLAPADLEVERPRMKALMVEAVSNFSSAPISTVCPCKSSTKTLIFP